MAAAQTTYDTKNQLLSEQSTRAGGYTFNFAYDLAQNPATFKGQSRTYNANNQLVGTGFAYDGNGNPVLYKGVNLAFDPENRMTAYGNLLTAGYNGDGLRAWKQTAVGRRYYLYDGEELVCELDAVGNVVAPVVFGANGLVVYSGYIYQFDPQGNAVHIMDDDGRTVLANLAYDAWGQLMSGSNPTPYGYKGQGGYYTDSETGLLLLDRYLDLTTGRYLTRGPIGFDGGINLYTYNRNRVVAPPEQLPGSGTGGGNGYKPVPPPRVPRPPFIIRCVCVLGLLLCAKSTAPPEMDELYPGPEPPCSDFEQQGYTGTNPTQTIKEQHCSKSGDDFKKRPKIHENPKRCPAGGKHYRYDVTKSEHISVLCCLCRTASGVTSQRCKCWRKPTQYK